MYHKIKQVMLLCFAVFFLVGFKNLTPLPEEEVIPVSLLEESEDLASQNKKLIVIDAGHQLIGDYSLEPIGPGATKTKPKVSSGTRGITTKKPEYELNLEVALKLQDKLLEQGYEVLMIRTTHAVNISNSERAQVANEANADAFLRIHANGSSSSSTQGMMTICQTENNPYNQALYIQSKRLSEWILDSMIATTAAKREKVWETDSMSGINWATVPTTIIEMGYMSHSKEDQLLASPTYQDQIIEGICNGLALYFSESDH